MQPFTLTQPKNAQTAIQAAAGDQQSKYLGGGTNLIDLMKMYVEQPRQLVDINGIALQKIERTPAGGALIGALVRNSDLAYDTYISSQYPMVAQALLSGASAQLRNMATTAGNILQRTRCPYFFNTSFPCNKRVPGSGCSAIKGFNRTHAILGTSDKCIAAHPSDFCVPLIALDAVVHVQGTAGKRTIPFADFHLLPGQTPERENVLQPAELITHIELPALSFARRSHYLKVRDRASYAFALTSAAVALDISGGTIQSARIALGGVGTKPWRSPAAEAVLRGAPNNEQSYRAAAEAALKDAKPYKYNAFKIDLAKRTLIKALATTGGMS